MINLLDYIDAAIFLVPMIFAASTLTFLTYKFVHWPDEICDGWFRRRSRRFRRSRCPWRGPARDSQAGDVANSAHFTSIQVSFGLHIALWPLNYRS